MPGGKLVVYFVRRDLRVSDNPVLHQLAGPSSTHAFTHLLPVFLFPSHQVEVSGFLKDGESSPYPPARSQVGNFWRCGPHRAKFIAQSVWDLKTSLEALGSGLILRAGNSADVLLHLIQNLQSGQHPVSAVWMTEEHSHEEKQEQQKLARICEDKGLDFHLWKDEKYFIVELVPSCYAMLFFLYLLLLLLTKPQPPPTVKTMALLGQKICQTSSPPIASPKSPFVIGRERLCLGPTRQPSPHSRKACRLRRTPSWSRQASMAWSRGSCNLSKVRL